MISKPITALSETYYPRFMLFFDTESYINPPSNKVEKHTFRLAVCIYVELAQDYSIKKREVFHAYSIQEFWDYVMSKVKRDRTIYVYAHNIKYDLINVDFLNMLNSYNFVTEYPIMASHFIMSSSKTQESISKKGKLTVKRKKLVFLDTFNYDRSPLVKMGEKLGIRKINLFDDSNDVDFNKIDNKTLVQYCERDVEIIEKFILSLITFLNNGNLGSLKYTLASTAFSVWRTKFNTENVFYHNDPDVISFERDSYYGGRVECFYIGKAQEKLYYLDINSMYPYVMRFPLPVKHAFIPQNMDALTILSLENIYFIAEVLLDTEDNINPYAVRQEQKLIFPKGHFKAFLHDTELRYAIQHNHLKQIYKIYAYVKDYCLRDYVDYFYPLKSNATNEVDRTMVKLFLNSLYGRFGMRHPETDYADLPPDDGFILLDSIHILQGENSRNVYHVWNNKIYRSYYVRDFPRRNINVALAGSVTAYARMELFNFIKQAGLQNVYYCDTDSLFVNEYGFARLEKYIDDKQLGLLKLEDQSENVVINAPKNYQFGSKKRAKGLGKGAQFYDDKYHFYRFTSIKDYINSGGEKFGRELVSKHFDLQYTKGIVTDNGRVIPHTLNINP